MMNTTIKLEELGFMLLGIYLFSLLNYQWWWFLVLFFVPDISMLGYAFGNRMGALFYNIYLSGIYLQNHLIQLIGIVMFAHSSFDRLLGYGLKTEEGFQYTHLGKIGNES